MSDINQRFATFRAVVASFAGSLISILLFRLPFWSGPMYGDDYLLVNGAQQPVDSSGVLGDFFLVGGGKWRPFNTPLLLFLARRFGFEYQPYQIVNLSLLVICCTVVGLMVWLLSRSLFATLLSSVCIGASSFTWLGQISVYGVLEFSAILVALLALLVELREFLGDRDEGKSHYLAIGLVLVASFIHERMLVLALLFGVFHLLKRRKSVSLTYFAIILIHVILKGFFLQLDASQSGGESNLQDVRGLWILRHFIDGVGALFGMNSGSGIFYTDGALSDLARTADLGYVGVLPIVTVSIVIGVLTFRESRADRLGTRLGCSLLILGVGLGCIFPAALVYERIEGRWLFLPQALLLVGLFGLIGSWTNTRNVPVLRSSLRTSLAIAFLVPAVYYRTQSNAFTFLRDQPSAMIAHVSTTAPEKGPWFLVVGHTDPTIPFRWQTGYARAFEQLPNPPIEIVWGNAPNDCPQTSSPLPCVVAISKDQNLRPNINVYVSPVSQPSDTNDPKQEGD